MRAVHVCCTLVYDMAPLRCVIALPLSELLLHKTLWWSVRVQWLSAVIIQSNTKDNSDFGECVPFVAN